MNSSPRNGAPIDRIYVHTNEGPENNHSARGLKAYLANIDAGYHWVVDDTEVLLVARDDLIVEACGGDNTHSVSVCIIGYANQSAAQWADPYSLAALDRAALVVADWCILHGIPTTRIRPGAPPSDRGIGGHVDNQSPRSGGHTDPGVNFPWEAFLARVRALLNVPQIDWAAINVLAAWKARVSKKPLRFLTSSPDVQILKDLLTLQGYSTWRGKFYGWQLRRAVRAWKVRERLANQDGKVFGADAASAILS